MNAIAEAGGFTILFTNTRWDGIFVALAAGEFDAVISAATITEERSETVDFSDTYFEAGQSITVQAANTDIAGPADLDGRPVGVQLGTTGDIWLTDSTGAEVIRYDENTLAFQALANGDVDAAVADAPTAIEIVKANPEMALKVLPDTYTEEVYGIAVNKDRPEVLEAINAGLAAVRDSGEYDEIYNEYFAVEEPEVEEPAGELFWTQEKRQAIAAAMDREEIVDRVFEGRNIPAYHMVPVGYPYATEPFLDKYGFRDLDMSIQILTDLGYTADAPFEFELNFPPEHYGTTTADVMQVIKEQLEETGLMSVDLQSQNWAEYVDSFVDGDLPFFILGWFPDFADPENWLSPFASCIQSPDLGVNYCSDIMDPMLATAAASPDPAEREALYQDIGDFWAEDIPTIPLFWEPEFVTVRDGVEGVDIGSTFEFNYNQLEFGDGAAPAAGSTDTIIIGTTDEVHSLDAQDAYAVHDWEILKNTGVALLSYVPGSSEMIPGVAADFPVASNDGKTYTFTLKEGVTYADGTPVTAQDYVYAWDRLNTIEGDVSGLIQLYVESVEAPDDMTVVYNLNAASGFFPALAATAPFIPSNPNQFPADEMVAFPAEMDGVGPYRMASYTPGEQMVLEANPNYWGDDPAKIPTVIVRYFADPTTMSNAVETGEIDIAWRILGAVEAVRLMDVAGLTVTKIEAPALRYLVFNHTYAE
jgi:peptide/nickel transport system substrate-binding protein